MLRRPAFRPAALADSVLLRLPRQYKNSQTCFTLRFIEEAARHGYERAVRTHGVHPSDWIRVEFDDGAGFDGARPYQSARLLQYADCTRRTQDTKSFFQDDAPRGLGALRWASTVEDDVLRLEPPEPGSGAGQLRVAACARRP